MATSGTPKEGLDLIGERTYVNGADLTLIAYTNTADSLNADSVYADLTQPTSANGYAPILLNGTWTATDGIMTYVHSTPTHPTWTATGTWSATVRGVAIVSGTSTLVHFKDLSVAFTAANGRKLAVDLDTVIA